MTIKTNMTKPWLTGHKYSKLTKVYTCKTIQVNWFSNVPLHNAYHCYYYYRARLLLLVCCHLTAGYFKYSASRNILHTQPLNRGIRAERHLSLWEGNSIHKRTRDPRAAAVLNKHRGYIFYQLQPRSVSKPLLGRPETGVKGQL